MVSQVKAGIVLSYISMGFNIIASFIYIPIILNFITQQEYGLYQLMGSVIAYLTVMDFGLSATITRYYSQANAINDIKSKENILAITSILYLIISFILVFIGVFIYFNIDTVFESALTMDEIEKARQIFVVMIFNIAITIPSHIFSSVIISNEKFIFQKTVIILQTIVQPIAIIIALNLNADIINIVIAQTIVNILVIASNVVYCFAKLNIKIKLHYFNRKLITEILGYSFFIFLNLVIDQIFWKSDQIILGTVIGTGAVAVYSIASQLITAYMSFSSSISIIMLPRLSAISALSDDMTDINSIFIRVGRIQFLIMSVILTGFIGFGKEFILYWVGQDYETAYYIALVVMIPLLIPLIQNTGVSILQAKNKHVFRSIVNIGVAILNILLSIPFAKMYGGLGCAIVTAFSLLLGQILIINIYYNNIGIDIKNFFIQIFKMAIPAVFCLITAIFINYFWRSGSIITLCCKIIIYCVIYTVIMGFFSLNAYEKHLIKRILKKLKPRKAI